MMYARAAKAAALAILLGLAIVPSFPLPASAVSPGGKSSVPGTPTLALESGSGRIVTLNGSAANVFVADPKVAEVRPASPGTLFVFGVGPGRTTIAAVDASGQALLDTQVVVHPSSYAATQAQI
ncbi:MAG: pilus assembly protein N-terminal domain-containing protein, partial [Acetobacteraceae bacterium]|nr:pilus assembly protein N-terminal domain-containing protein [Acetobacteraceae bacterium]